MAREPQIIFAHRVATPEEATTTIGDFVPDREPSFRGPALVYDADTKTLIAAHLPVSGTRELRAALPTIGYSQMNRANNYGSQSTTFGYAPRRPVLGREGCAASAIQRDNDYVQGLLDDLSDQCARSMQDFAPELVEKDRQTLAPILPEWRMGEEKLWSSGVINNTAQLPYHRDNFNFPAWSAMPVLRRGIRGGYLHLPEYDLVIPCQDQYAAYFKGQELVHGVTPLRKRQEDGYRFSIVFYALKGMKDCFTHAAETAYAQRRRSERERDMAKRLAAGERGIPGYTAPAPTPPGEADSAAEQIDHEEP